MEYWNDQHEPIKAFLALFEGAAKDPELSSGLKKVNQLIWFDYTQDGPECSFHVDCRNGNLSVAQGKPAPDLYLFAAQRLGVEAKNCLAIEDSLNGVIASTAAGMVSLAVPEIEHSVISTLESMTPYTFHGLNQVREFLVENKILRG